MLNFLLLAAGVFGFITFLDIKKKRYKEVPFMFTVIVFEFAGCLLTLFIHLFIPNSDKYVFIMLCFTFGGLLILTCINNIRSLFKCNKKLEGKYCGYNSYYGGKGVSSQFPVFEYIYDKREYHEQSAQTVSYKQLTKKMTVGEMYIIYIDKKHPAVFVLNKRMTFGDFMMMIIGTICFAAGLFALNL